MATATYKIIRGQKVEFGCTNETLPKSYGTILSASTDTQAQSVTVPNEAGAVVDLVVYDQQTSVTLTCLLKADLQALPEVGDTMTINNLTAIITGIKHDWSNTTLRQMTLTGTVYHNLSEANA